MRAAARLGVQLLRPPPSSRPQRRLGDVGDQIAPCGPGAVRYRGGYAALADGLAATLAEGTLMLGCRAVAVRQGGEGGDESDGGVCVTYRAGADGSESAGADDGACGGEARRECLLRARRVVLALPPGVGAQTLGFDPPLPHAQVASPPPCV